jgi:hypothetical protein
MLMYDYDNLHSSIWENHKVTWTVSGLFIPIIFTLEGYFLQQYFEQIEKTTSLNTSSLNTTSLNTMSLNTTSLEQLVIFIFGAFLIQSLTIIWWLVMSAFHDLNEKRIQRLQEIEGILRKDSIKDLLLVNHYNCLYPHIKNEESKKKPKFGISQDLQSEVLKCIKTKSVQIKVKPVYAPITWSNPADITYGTPLGPNQLNANTSVHGIFDYTLETDGTTLISGVTILPVGTHTLVAKFTPTNPKSILSRLLSSLFTFLTLVYIPLIMPLVLMTKYKISVDRWTMKKPWNVMNIYLLVVIIPYSLNLIIFIYLLFLKFYPQ